MPHREVRRSSSTGPSGHFGSRTARRYEEMHRRILRAARSQIAEHGLGALTMKGVADAADVAVGTIYNHFADRDEVIDALVTAELLAPLACLATDAATNGQTPTSVLAYGVAQRAREIPDWAPMAASLLDESPSARAMTGRELARVVPVEGELSARTIAWALAEPERLDELDQVLEALGAVAR